MRRVLAGAAIGAVALALLPTIGAQEVFRATGDVVRVFVTVTNRDGRLDTTLTKQDFEIRDERTPQAITLFDKTPQPIRLIVMLDVSGSMEGNLPLLRGASEQLFAHLGKDDVARVGSFGDEVTVSPAFTHDFGELLGALPQAINPDAPTPLWRGIGQAIDTFGGGGATREQRDVILVLSDGKDAPLFSFRQRPVSQGEVIDRARRADVMIYGVGMRSRPSRPPAFGPGGMQAMLLADLPDPGLARVAEETGGGYAEIRFGEDLGAAFAAVVDELHGQYLLGFPPPRRDGKKHDISVRVIRAGFKPRARKSYVAPTQ